MGTPTSLWQLPEPLQSTLRRCLEKNPDARFPQVCDLSTQLNQNPTEIGTEVGPEDGTKAGPDGERLPALEKVVPALVVEASIPIPTSTHRHKWWAVGAAVTLCVLLLGGIYARHVLGLPRAASPIPASRIPAASKVPKPPAAENPNVTVWVNTNSGTYHCPGTRWYGKTHEGEYIKQKQAKEKGFHPAANQACL